MAGPLEPKQNKNRHSRHLDENPVMFTVGKGVRNGLGEKKGRQMFFEFLK